MRGGRPNAIRDKFNRCIAVWGSLASSQSARCEHGCVYLLYRQAKRHQKVICSHGFNPTAFRSTSLAGPVDSVAIHGYLHDRQG